MDRTQITTEAPSPTLLLPLKERWSSSIIRPVIRSKAGMCGGLIVLVFVFLAVMGRTVAPYDPLAIDLSSAKQAPSGEHWLGTDTLGRDLFSRILAATRVEAQIAFVSTGIALAVGIPLGLVSGYLGRRVDMIGTFLIDLVLAFPAILLAMTLVGILGAGATNISVAIGLVSFPIFARLTRASALSLKQQPLVEAARVLGATNIRVLFRHIFPNAVEPLIVQSSLLLGFAILTESGLSFLGVGLRPPEPAWGSMLRDGMPSLRDAPYLTILPGLAIFLTVLGFNLLGDGLNEALNPRNRGRTVAAGRAWE